MTVKKRYEVKVYKRIYGTFKLFFSSVKMQLYFYIVTYLCVAGNYCNNHHTGIVDLNYLRLLVLRL